MSLSGTASLAGFILRRDKVRLTVWVVGLLVFCVYYVTAIGAVYPTAADRQNRAETMTTPGGILLGGPGYGLDDYTVGAMFANELTLWLMVLLAAMNILQITRNTRAEEASGRAEMIRALPVGRHALPVSALLVVLLANVLFALVGSVLLIAVGGLAVADSFVTMTGVALTACVFAAVTTATAQMTVHPRTASGLAFGVLGLAVFIRGVGDIIEDHGSWLSWLSPLAWTQQLRGFVDLRLDPLALSGAAVVLTLAMAAVLAGRRDLGGALIHERTARATAGPGLSSPFALVLRQQRAGLIWWLIGCATLFGLSGLFIGQDAADSLNDIAGQNELTRRIFGDDPLGAFLAIMMLHNALAVGVYAVSAVLRISPEEDEGRLGLGLSRSVTRTGVLVSHLAVVALGSYLLLFLGGALPLWVGATISGGDVALSTLLASASAFAAGITVLIAFAAILFAWAPRITPLAWVLFAITVVESFFGALLNLPAAVAALSPFWWVGDYPSTPLVASHLLALVVAGLVLLLLSITGFRRRDLTTG